MTRRPLSSEETGGPLDRVLRLFAPVGPGEGATVLLMALNIFLLMTAYYIIKPVRESLILATWGPEAKIYASAGQALLLVGIVPLYSRLARALNSRHLITAVLLFFTGCLVGFYFLARLQVSLGIPFYLWVGVFNLMVVAQFWSFANDFYTPEQGRRLFALVGFGMSAGAVSGSITTGVLINSVGTYPLLLLSAALLLASLGLTLLTARRRPVAAKTDAVEAVAEPDAPLPGKNGFGLVFANRYLLLIALMMIVANLVNTTGEYVLGARVSEASQTAVPEIVRTPEMSTVEYQVAVADRTALIEVSIGRFYAGFFSVVNLVGLLAQLFLVARLVAWIGVGRALFVLPLVAVGGYLMMALVPVLGVARWAKTVENATDYSLQNTIRNMLFLPTTRAEKYKAKQAIDTFFVRMGDVMAALLVLGGTTVLHLAPTGFTLVNVGLALLWVLLVVAIARRHKRLTAQI